MMESSSHPSDASEQVSGTNENPVDAMELFRGQLEDILNTYGSADRLLEEKISSLEKDEENLEEESVKAGTQTSSSSEMKQAASALLEALGEEGLVLLQSLNTLQSPEDKLETVLRKYAELLKEQRNEQVKLKLLQKKQNVLVEQRDQLQLEHSKGILARSRLEKLCGDLHQHNATLTDNMLQKNQEDERKRTEIHSHFQNTVVDIQAQIEQHSSRNTKLSQENIELANRLTSIIQKYEKREESLEKLFKQKELQQQLSDAKLEDAQLRLKDAEEKHQREKEYLLREAIDKTKKCYTMKQQELQMKKQLVLYSQKFDEFQATLAKSNEVYAVFKQEMEKVTKKMKKLEKESNMWKIRFESCNKALTEMIEERSERGKELELFTVKIDKLETLCRALQEERKVLYEKIKEIRLQAISASAPPPDVTEEKIPDLGQLQVSEPMRNPALTAEMEKLWKEQERLQEFAASLLTSTAGDVDSSDSEEESAESKPPAPAVPEVMKPPIAITQNHAVEDGINEAVQLESNQQETKAPKVEALNEEPAKAEPPNEGLPKEPPKAESHKEKPPKAEPPNEELPKEPPKAEPPKVEPPKVEPPTVEPPKVEPPTVEPPKVEPPKGEPSKVEPPKVDPPKVEPPKVEPPKVEPPKVEPPKVADKNSAGVKPSQKLKHTQKSNKLNSADHPQEPQPHMEQDPKDEKTKQASGAEAECKEAEPQESKPGVNKPQGKKQSSTKRKGAAKGMKKS